MWDPFVSRSVSVWSIPVEYRPGHFSLIGHLTLFTVTLLSDTKTDRIVCEFPATTDDDDDVSKQGGRFRVLSAVTLTRTIFRTKIRNDIVNNDRTLGPNTHMRSVAFCRRAIIGELKFFSKCTFLF